MTPQTATILYVISIIGLFYLDRDPEVRTSKALWIPVIWLLIHGSRSVSSWFQPGPTISQMGDQYLEGSPFDAAIFEVLLAAGVVALSLRSRQVARLLRGNLPLVLFFGYCALSIAWSDYSFVSFKRWIKAVGDLVMVMVVLTDPHPLIATKRFLSRAAFILLPVSVLFIKYYPNLGRYYDRWTWIPMYGGVTEGKNVLGMICLVCGIGSVWSFAGAFENRKTPHRLHRIVAHVAIAAIAIWLCLLCDSKTSLTCLILAGVLMLITTQRWAAKHTSVVHALIAGFVVLSLFALFFDPGGSLVHSLGRDSTLTGRTRIWHAVLSLHTNPLIGTGFESFWMGSRLEQVWTMILEPGIQEAHNGYLEIYLNLGLVGVALLAVVIVTGYRNAIAIFCRDPHAGRVRLAFLTAGLIYSVTEAGFRMGSPTWIAFLLAVTVVPLNSKQKKLQRSPELPVPKLGH
jgi:O-antigen ligase